MHIPCTKKQMTLPSMLNHFRLYHKMKYYAAKRISDAIKTKSIHSNLILFQKNERIGTTYKRNY
jgi:hypothetical protein